MKRYGAVPMVPELVPEGMAGSTATDSLAGPGGSSNQPEDPTTTWFRRLVFYSISSALCAALPIPLLDEHLLQLVRRRQTRELGEDAGWRLNDTEVRHLSGTEPSLGWGCLLGVVATVVFKISLKLVKRVLRTVLFWLILKDASDAASLTFHEGFLQRQALRAGQRLPREIAQDTPEEVPTEEIRSEVRALRYRIVEVCEAIDTRPFQRLVKEAFGGASRLILGTTRLLFGFRPKLSEQEQEHLLREKVPSSVVDRLGRLLTAESGYLTSLEQAWDQASDQREDSTAQ